MIEIQCPACGAGGRASKQKTNARLVCKKCLKVFHITATGLAVLGEPPPTGEAAARTAVAVHDPTKDVDQWFERLSRVLFSPSTLILFVCLIGLLIGWAFYSRSENLEGRVEEVARAAYDGDIKALQAMAAEGNGEDVLKWRESVRPKLDDLRVSLGIAPPSVNVVIRGQDSSTGTADVVAQMSSEQELERRGTSLPDPSLALTSGKRTVDLPLRFRREGWNGWRLDAKQTLESAVPAQ
jgi:hypothetical protein